MPAIDGQEVLYQYSRSPSKSARIIRIAEQLSLVVNRLIFAIQCLHMTHIIRRIIRAIEEAPFSLPLWCAGFLALILSRLGIEGALGSFHPHSFSFLFFEFSHTFLFFAVSIFVLLPVIRWAGAPHWAGAAQLMLFGFLIILFPPIIDTLIFQDHAFWSFYEFDSLRGLVTRFFTLFGDTPDIGITYGVRIEVVLVTVSVGIYAFLKSRRISRAAIAALLTYSALFVLGTFPSFLTFLVQGPSKGLFAIGSADIAGLFLTPAELFSRLAPDMRSALNAKMSLWYALILTFLIARFTFLHARPIFFALCRNARIPQLIYHAGLLALGGLLAWHFATADITLDAFHLIGILLLLIAVECAWIASVIANDVFDTRIDRKTNPDRPLITGTIDPVTYRFLGWMFFFGSLFFAALVSFSASILLLIYQALAWIYSVPPYRLKRVPLVATLVASAAGIIVLLIGYVVISPESDFSTLPLPLLSFLFIAYAVALPLKDFKDIAGDRADGVYTFPVLFGEEYSRIIFGSVFFTLFIASVFVLHLPSAAIPALLFGSLSFFLMQIARREHPYVSYRLLPFWILSPIAGYGLVLLWLIIR